MFLRQMFPGAYFAPPYFPPVAAMPSISPVPGGGRRPSRPPVLPPIITDDMVIILLMNDEWPPF